MSAIFAVVAVRRLVTIDANVSFRQFRGTEAASMIVVTHGAARDALAAGFGFVARFSDEIDTYIPTGRIVYNVMHHKLGFRSFVDRRSRTPPWGTPKRLGGDMPIIAYDPPRPIARQALLAE